MALAVTSSWGSKSTLSQIEPALAKTRKVLVKRYGDVAFALAGELSMLV